MGLIRSGQTSLSPESPDSALTDFLWPVVREIVKTCVENGQNLIVEGCYIPFGRKKDFADDYLCDRYFFHPIAPNPSRILWKFSYSISSENRYRQMYGSRFQKRHKQRNTHDDHNVTNDTAIIVGISFYIPVPDGQNRYCQFLFYHYHHAADRSRGGVYNLEMIAARVFRLRSLESEAFRRWLLRPAGPEIRLVAIAGEEPVC